jgi:hypothetical protein
MLQPKGNRQKQPVRISWYHKAMALTMVSCFFVWQAIAQEKVSRGTSSVVELAASAGGGNFSGAISLSRAHRITKMIPNLSAGYGIRFTTFVGANKFYVTAPARFTSPVQNLTTIFSETIEANIDTITTATTVTNSLNLALFLHYAITPKIELGFNIDAAGFSFGSKRQFNVISSVYDPDQSPVQEGSPTKLNLLLTSDNDIGSLNSEFFIRYWLKSKLAIKGGFTFLFSEYQLDRKLSFDNARITNDRYRYKASMLGLGLTYKLSD